MAFGVDAATFTISVLALLGLRRLVEHREIPKAGRSPLAEATEGLRAVTRQPWVGAVILQGTVQVLLVHAPLMVLAPLVLDSRGELDAYGWLLSSQAIVAVAGALLAARWTPNNPAPSHFDGCGLFAG